MKKKTVALLSSLVVPVFMLALFAGTEAVGASKEEGPGANGSRSDVVVIDSLAKLGKLDEKAVVYLHEKHTEALAKRKDYAEKGCKTCHEALPESKWSWAYQPAAKAASKDAGRDAFHNGCVGCHDKMTRDGVKAGPLSADCRGCHNAEAGQKNARAAVVVDNRLHYRHAKPYADDARKCGVCHHAFDDAQNKIVPTVKETEVPGACVYCHKQADLVTPGGKPAKVRKLSTASHEQCVSCHLLEKAKKPDAAAPITCAGCHGDKAKFDIETRNAKAVEGVDAGKIRLLRGQPDATLVKAGVSAKAMADAPGLGQVAFPHKAHEAKVGSCSACHHAALTSCSADCHTPVGSKKGGMVNLGTAMHKPDSSFSCVGCHQKQTTANAACVGCHGQMPKHTPVGNASCGACHKKVDPAMLGILDTPGAREAMAVKMLAEPLQQTSFEGLPEKVTIGQLERRFEPVEFTHAKHIQSLKDGLKDDKLAAFGHSPEYATCVACHHNAPAGKTPGKCSSCHQGTDGDARAERMGLKAALHNQCMGCHSRMGLEGKTVSKEPGAKPVPAAVQCAGCHKEKPGVPVVTK